MTKKKLKLIYPGVILNEEFLKPLGITAYKLAKDLSIGQITISQILKGKRRISVEMALRFSKYFGNSPEFWINMQTYFDLEVEKEKNLDIIEKIKPFRSQSIAV
jgi:addiction module HigA family antidote